MSFVLLIAACDGGDGGLPDAREVTHDTVLDEAPAAVTSATTAHFVFHADDVPAGADVTFTCRLDDEVDDEELSVERAAQLASRIALLPAPAVEAAALAARWRADGASPLLATSVGTALLAAGDRLAAAAAFQLALAALADEPTVARLLALRGLAATGDSTAAASAAAFATSLPELGTE